MINRAPVMALPRLEGAYTVEFDACDKQIGYVVLQKQPNGTHETNKILDLFVE